jgi:hypothetical protein
MAAAIPVYFDWISPKDLTQPTHDMAVFILAHVVRPVEFVEIGIGVIIANAGGHFPRFVGAGMWRNFFPKPDLLILPVYLH